MKVLIVGESWVTHLTHVKGFDSFTNSVYEEGVKWLRDALESNGIQVDYLPNHEAPNKFPYEAEELKQYNTVILSDIGSNSLLLSTDTFNRSISLPNRLNVIERYVNDGGGFIMVGGYLSFQGIDGKARYKGTAIEKILPVELLAYDDRMEAPEGIQIDIVEPNHPVLDGIPTEWPHFLGYNIVKVKPSATLLAEHQGNAFIAVGDYGRGRTMSFASDCAPHWGPSEFVNWPYYASFWAGAVKWVSRVI